MRLEVGATTAFLRARANGAPSPPASIDTPAAPAAASIRDARSAAVFARNPRAFSSRLSASRAAPRRLSASGVKATPGPSFAGSGVRSTTILGGADGSSRQ